MDINTFIALLLIFSTISSVCVESLKGLLNDMLFKYSDNILAFIVSCVVGICGTFIYYGFANLSLSHNNFTCAILMGICTSVGSMVGYDKVVQTIKQFEKINK